MLLLKPDVRFVVRGSRKADLMCEGQVIQCFEFFKDWTEEEVFQNLSDAFAEILHETL